MFKFLLIHQQLNLDFFISKNINLKFLHCINVSCYFHTFVCIWVDIIYVFEIYNSHICVTIVLIYLCVDQTRTAQRDQKHHKRSLSVKRLPMETHAHEAAAPRGIQFKGSRENDRRCVNIYMKRRQTPASKLPGQRWIMVKLWWCGAVCLSLFVKS